MTVFVANLEKASILQSLQSMMVVSWEACMILFTQRSSAVTGGMALGGPQANPVSMVNDEWSFTEIMITLCGQL